MPGRLNILIGVLLICSLLTSAQAYAGVVINEFMPDADQEWVELYNPESGADYLKEYWLDDDTVFDDDAGTSSKRHLTNLNTADPKFPFIALTSNMFNNSGDTVAIFDADGNLIDHYQYSANPGKNISIGRTPDQIGGFSILLTATPGSANSGPLPTSTPTPTPTPAPTPSPTPTPTPTPTPKPTGTPTPTPKPSPTKVPSPTLTPTVLGEFDEDDSPAPEEHSMDSTQGDEQEVAAEMQDEDRTGDQNKSSEFTTPLLISGAGLILLTASSVPFARKKLSAWRKKSGRSEREDG